MESRVVENADGGTGKISAAAQSAARFFLNEDEELGRAIALGENHLQHNPRDTQTAESVAELRRQRADLRARWSNSSVRRAIEKRSDQLAALGGVESRVGLASPASDIRAAGTSTKTATTISGYAAIYNQWSVIAGAYLEQNAPGCFANALKKSDVVCSFNHNVDHLLGRESARTLELKEDGHGLHFRCYLLPYDSLSYGLARRIDRGDIAGCSYMFTIAKDTWEFASKPGEMDRRTILEIDQLFELGPVVWPAFPQTSVVATFADVTRSAPAAEPALPQADDDDEEAEGDRFIADYHRRERQREYDYQEMGRLIRDVQRVNSQ